MSIRDMYDAEQDRLFARHSEIRASMIAVDRLGSSELGDQIV